MIGIDPFDKLLGYHLRRLSVAVMGDITESLAPLGLKPSDASVLFMIAANHGLTQSDIGRALGIQRANMAPLIASLMKRKFIEREALDGRSQALQLSEKGIDAQQRALAITNAHEDRLFGKIARAERDRLVKQLRGLWQNIAQNSERG